MPKEADFIMSVRRFPFREFQLSVRVIPLDVNIGEICHSPKQKNSCREESDVILKLCNIVQAVLVKHRAK